ncbi:two-component system response regulator PmrA [[Erwinia] mediterraneensis]|uniref:two-component system response regulator PmrA n=1 Tax=[Erwinia] mediterraneensis TaxID=2161819 RepID=UPI001031534C|nr:two-component system response regulator PmrA [[Erwinia] mediterraneensis]
MKILIVEDDTLLLQGLIMAVQREGYVCDGVSTVREAEASLDAGIYSLLILDLGLPDEDGLKLLLRLRRQKIMLPVLILTARDTVSERIAGLDAGADDYLIKPFALDELLARLRALIRRHVSQGESLVQVNDLTLDMNHRQIYLAGTVLDLTPKEYAILARLMLKAGNPVHREILYHDIYNWESEPSTNTLEVHIHNLRDKIGKASIRTVRGFGYTLIRNTEQSEPL